MPTEEIGSKIITCVRCKQAECKSCHSTVSAGGVGYLKHAAGCQMRDVVEIVCSSCANRAEE